MSSGEKQRNASVGDVETISADFDVLKCDGGEYHDHSQSATYFSVGRWLDVTQASLSTATGVGWWRGSSIGHDASPRFHTIHKKTEPFSLGNDAVLAA